MSIIYYFVNSKGASSAPIPLRFYDKILCSYDKYTNVETCKTLKF